MAGSRVDVVTIDTPSLGDRSYVVIDGRRALVVDPQRDIDRVQAVVAAHDAEIVAVAETHIHNDYLTGGHALARDSGADHLINRDDPVAFPRRPVSHGDVVPLGTRTTVRVVATPGHTRTHLSYVLNVDDASHSVFTGGSLLLGATGRTDLLGPDHARELAGQQWRSARTLAMTLPDVVAVHPTHGFGSLCATGSPSDDPGEATIGGQAGSNPALLLGRDAFVVAALTDLDEPPAYYARIGPANLAGPPAIDLSPPPVIDGAELRQRIAAGEWVIDLRSRSAFAVAHLAGVINLGADGPLAVQLGSLLPPGTPVTLLGSDEQIATAQRELARIGIDRPRAVSTAAPATLSGSAEPGRWRTATFDDLAAARRGRPVVVLDVRRDGEWSGGHLAGAVHVPLPELPRRVNDVPPGELWVHCGVGYRAAAAASILARHGRQAVLVDDHFDRAAAAGLTVLTGSGDRASA